MGGRNRSAPIHLLSLTHRLRLNSPPHRSRLLRDLEDTKSEVGLYAVSFSYGHQSHYSRAAEHDLWAKKSHHLYPSTQPCLLCKGPSWLDQQTVDTPHRRTRVSGPSLGHLVTPPRHSYAVLPQLHMNVVWEVLGCIGWGSEWKRSHLYCYGEAIMHAGWGHHNATIFWSPPSCLVTSHPYSVKKFNELTSSPE